MCGARSPLFCHFFTFIKDDIFGAEYILKMLPKGTHDYSKFIKPSELESWARDADLHLRELTGMSYNLLSKKYSLGHDVDVNYLMHYQK